MRETLRGQEQNSENAEVMIDSLALKVAQIKQQNK
jgi:hypothetical protein